MNLDWIWTIICSKHFFTALLCKIAVLRTFSLDKLQYWRERASGISSLAHFLAKDTIDHFSTVIKPAVYLSMFYFFSYPRSSFAENYTVMLALVYCVTAIAYVLAIFLDPGPSQLVSDTNGCKKVFGKMGRSGNRSEMVRFKMDFM